MAVDISVIIPAHNAEGTLGRCLDALEHQDVPADTYEMIVVDDGSTDKTANVVRRYAARYVFQPQSGPASARNRGVTEANGSLILFTDADCVPTHTWIGKMTAPFSDPLVTAVKGVYRTEQKRIMARFAQIEFEERYALLRNAVSIDMIDTYSAGYRKSAFEEIGGFDRLFPTANNEDTDLSYRMARAGKKMVFQPEAIVLHLNHPDTAGKYARLKFRRGYWRMAVYRRYPGKMIADTYTPPELKIQVLLVSSLVPATALAFLVPYLSWLPGAVVLGHLVVSWPFFATAVVRDPLLAPLSPFLLFLRSGALAVGSICGGFAVLGGKFRRRGDESNRKTDG